MQLEIMNSMNDDKHKAQLKKYYENHLYKYIFFRKPRKDE